MPTAPDTKPPVVIQPRLLRVPELRPLLTVEAVRAALSYTEDEVVCDIEDGSLEWAWNIGVGESQRREIRVFAGCVEQRRACLENPRRAARQFGRSEIDAALFPRRGGKPFVKSPDVRLAFACSPDLVTDLIDAGDLTLLDGTSYSAGRNGAALIAWSSVTRFLSARRI